MPHIVIDGIKIEAKPGTTVIQAAYENGMEITHFCWHPELSISGNCRMCLVEIGMPKRLPDGSFEKDANDNLAVSYIPKLQIACATIVSEGMQVRTKTDKVVQAQEAVMEFLLINHPLDCPICDEAGQCKLQEYAFKHSAGVSRFDEMKNRKDKRQVWGPNVLFDAERCISCSRCIRFAKEIAHQDVLTFVQRGDHVTIKLFEGTEFNSPYSMNVIDICPVGALTSRDFRFKSRVWDMSFNDTICNGCARGCNVKLGVRNNEILRIEPATNMHVNKYWMCDYGRLTQYKNVNENRVLQSLIKDSEERIEVGWEDVYNGVKASLANYKGSEVLFIASPYASTEDNYILSKFARELIKSERIYYLPRIDESFKDDFLRLADMTPNGNGLKALGINPLNNPGAIIKEIEERHIKAIYTIDDDFSAFSTLFRELNHPELLIVHAQNHTPLADRSDIMIATSTYAEIEGTYVNHEGRVQHFMPALTTKENLRIMGMKMSRLDKFGAHNDRWTHHEGRATRQSWRSLQHIAKLMGADWKYRSSSDVFNEIAQTIKAFHGMNYELLDEYQGLVLNKADRPDPKVLNYESHFMKPF